jgi:universal stress protein A
MGKLQTVLRGKSLTRRPMNIPRKLVDCSTTNSVEYEILRHPEALSRQRVAEAERVIADKKIVKAHVTDITMKAESKPSPLAPRGASSVEQAAGSKKNDHLIGCRRLLVPIDFSEHSKKTIEYATSLAALTGAPINILHILQIPVYPTGFYRGIYIQPEMAKEVVETAQREAKEKLALVIRDIRAKGLQAQSILRVGAPYEEIVRMANEMDMDFIVIGSRGYRGVARCLVVRMNEFYTMRGSPYLS